MKNQVSLVSFADSRLHRSAKRFIDEATDMCVFSSIRIFSENTLNLENLGSASSLLSPQNRGFGYWVWKPAVILETLLQSEENELVLYADIGCSFNPRGLSRFYNYLEMVQDDPLGILAFQNYPPQDFPVWDGRWLPFFPDAQWSKGDLLDYFQVRANVEVIETPSLAAGIIFFRNTPMSRRFVEQWLDIMVSKTHLIDDSDSIAPNHPWFIASRHDQSVFSLLGKLQRVSTVSASEFWYPLAGSFKPDWGALALNPIHATRSLNFGLLENLRIFVRNKFRGLSFRLRKILGLRVRLYAN